MRRDGFFLAISRCFEQVAACVLFACLPVSIAMAVPQANPDVPPDATPQVQQINPGQAAAGAKLSVVVQGSNFSGGAYVSSVSPMLHVDSSKRVSATEIDAQLSVSATAQPSTLSLLVSNPASRAAEAAFKIVVASAPPAAPVAAPTSVSASPPAAVAPAGPATPVVAPPPASIATPAAIAPPSTPPVAPPAVAPTTPSAPGTVSPAAPVPAAPASPPAPATPVAAPSQVAPSTPALPPTTPTAPSTVAPTAPATPSAPATPAAPASPAAPTVAPATTTLPAPAAPEAPVAPTTPAAPPAPATPPAPAAPAGPPGPEVSAVDPPRVAPGFDTDLKITGKNFGSGAKVSFANPGVRVVGITSASNSELDVHIKVAKDAAPGAGSLFVINPDDTEVEAPFEVTGKGGVMPAAPSPATPPGAPAATGTPSAPAATNIQRYDAFHLGNPAEIFEVHGKVKGALVVSAQTIEYQEDGKTLVSIALSDIKEIKTSSIATSTFHITLTSGKTYHFAPGSLRPADARNLVDTLRKSVPQ